MSQVPDQYIEETAELLGFVGALSVQIKHYNWKPEDYLNLPEYKKFFGDVDIFAKSPKKNLRKLLKTKDLTTTP